MNRTPLKAAVAAATLAFLAACADSAPLSPVAGAPASTSQAPEEVMDGEIIVRLADDASPSTVARDNGMEVAAAMRPAKFYVLRGTTGTERAHARAILRDPRVLYAEPNYLRKATTIDSRLWAFYNPGGLNMLYTTGASKGKPLPSSYASTLDADEDNIEGYAAGGADVVIGSIDTGVDLTHPEFTGRLIAGKDWYNNDNDPTDDEGHGSHTTGTMAGSTVGVAGVSGAAPHVKVYVQKVCGRRGCPTSAIVNAIYAAADYPNMVAMNLSLGGTSESQAEKDAIAYATSKGVLVIASAGNDGVSTVACPACDPNSISVSATT